MPKGFFNTSKLKSDDKTQRAARCGLCGLYKHCITPKMQPSGKGRKKILLVAEAPGAKEDELNQHLIGQSGLYLKRQLRRLGIDLHKDCIKTNAVICRRQNNETPTDEMIMACRPNLIKTIKKYEPNVIILLGAVSVKSMLKHIWKEDIGVIGKWGGSCIPCHNPNTWIVPTYHPSYLLRMDDKILNRIFHNHLKLAISKAKSKPWKNPPDYKSQVEVIMRPSKAAREIKGMMAFGGKMAFDYESNCLKPEGKGPEIISCSICRQGKQTISFPWSGEVIDTMETFLKSPIKKIAHNLKFEDRWTRAILGFPVNGWFWDTMIAAHTLDNTPGITGLKFQSFILLGQESYDDHVKPFFKPKKGSRFNRIKELDLNELLLYGGLDSLLTYKIAMKQINKFKKREQK